MQKSCGLLMLCLLLGIFLLPRLIIGSETLAASDSRQTTQELRQETTPVESSKESPQARSDRNGKTSVDTLISIRLIDTKNKEPVECVKLAICWCGAAGSIQSSVSDQKRQNGGIETLQQEYFEMESDELGSCTFVATVDSRISTILVGFTICGKPQKRKGISSGFRVNTGISHVQDVEIDFVP